MTGSPPPSSAGRSVSGLGRRVDAFIVAVAVACVAASTLVASIELGRGIEIGNGAVFAIVAVLLVVTEIRSTPLLKHARSSVTPSWAFTFTLMLLGSPTVTLLLSAVVTVLADVIARKPAIKALFNTTQIGLSLALGALVLFAFGVHGPVFDGGPVGSDVALAIIVSGVVVFSTNGIIICRLLAWIEGSGFWTMMRSTFLLSMTADAAMLAIAPIFLITAQNNLLLLPLMGTATFFVYQTAQDALSRAHEANHDALTQLVNRRAFNEAIGQHLAANGPSGNAADASVFILDLDRFKEVNDRLGHRTGDLVLQEFAARLVESLPRHATVARLGGDEFAVLLPDAPTSAMDCARQLHAALSEPLIVDGFPLSAGSSIGVAHAASHGETASDLMHAADVAMYRAKRNRSGVEEYHAIGKQVERGRMTLLADVAEALEEGQFHLAYQPQVDLASGCVVAAEALLRWDHPIHGRIMPDQFIALAEHTDLIEPITGFVVDRSLRDLAALHRDGHEIGISINVSARNLENRGFVRNVIDALHQHGIPSSHLEIEVTEAAIAQDPELIVVAFDELRSHGITVAVDDFGKGYASFDTLRRHDVDRIKIDRSFVADLATSAADDQIVGSLVSLAHTLGLDVVAEGVESAEVADVLRRHGCDLGQGFLFSAPVPFEDLVRLCPSSTQPDSNTAATEAVPA
ncbi:MAG: bifunctional diguanylate cyclase/phosphodiesterase [Actinomycetota bacterium]